MSKEERKAFKEMYDTYKAVPKEKKLLINGIIKGIGMTEGIGVSDNNKQAQTK